MATSLDLMQDVYANFLGAYAGEAARGDVVIAFEPLGIMPGLDPNVAGAGAQAVEFLSINADELPNLGGGSYVASGRTVSGAYRMMLGAASPADADVAAFNALKASAVEMADNATLGSSQGPFTFYPVFASPANWYDPSCQANWTSYAFTAGASAPAAPPLPAAPSTQDPGGPPPPQPPPRRFPMGLINADAWRLRTLAPASVIVTQAPPTPVSTFHPAMLPVQHALALNAALLPVHASVATPLVVDNASPAPPLQPQFTLSFQYCVLQLRRPWLSGDFLADPEWHIPGAHAGDYSAGPTAAQAAAAAGAAGAANDVSTPPAAPFSWLPVACIAIKNLAIGSTGGALDPSVATAAAFGPFAFHGSAGASTNSLTNPGIQIVAWICAAQPRLPPLTDPALIPPTDAQTTGTIVATAIGVLESLLGVGKSS